MCSRVLLFSMKTDLGNRFGFRVMRPAGSTSHFRQVNAKVSGLSPWKEMDVSLSFWTATPALAWETIPWMTGMSKPRLPPLELVA